MSQTLTFDAALLNLTSFTKAKSSWTPQEQRGSRRIYSEVTTCCLKLSGTPVESTSNPPGVSCISKTDNPQKCWHWLGGGGDWLLVQCPRVVLVCRYKVHIVTLLQHVSEIKQGWVIQSQCDNTSYGLTSMNSSQTVTENKGQRKISGLTSDSLLAWFW